MFYCQYYTVCTELTIFATASCKTTYYWLLQMAPIDVLPNTVDPQLCFHAVYDDDQKLRRKAKQAGHSVNNAWYLQPKAILKTKYSKLGIATPADRSEPALINKKSKPVYGTE